MPDIELTSAELERLLCGDEVNGGFVRDLCFTVWSLCHNPTHEDGNTDWSNDTLPTVQEGVKRIRHHIRSLARAGLEARKAEESMREPYLVWSNEHHAWWRPNSQGYAKSIEDAGVYSREEAMDIARTSRNGWTVDHTPDEIPVAVADIPERMRSAIRALPLTGDKS